MTSFHTLIVVVLSKIFMIFRGDEMLDLISVLVNSVVVHLTSIVSTPFTPIYVVHI